MIACRWLAMTLKVLFLRLVASIPYIALQKYGFLTAMTLIKDSFKHFISTALKLKLYVLVPTDSIQLYQLMKIILLSLIRLMEILKTDSLILSMRVLKQRSVFHIILTTQSLAVKMARSIFGMCTRPKKAQNQSDQYRVIISLA